MPLTRERLLELQSDCHADDIEIPDEAVAWVEKEAIDFFQSGGETYPRPAGLESCEIHAYYDKRRDEVANSSDTMLAALERALRANTARAASSAPGASGAWHFLTELGLAEFEPPLRAALAELMPAFPAEGCGYHDILLSLEMCRTQKGEALRSKLTDAGMKVGQRQRLVKYLEENNNKGLLGDDALGPL